MSVKAKLDNHEIVISKVILDSQRFVASRIQALRHRKSESLFSLIYSSQFIISSAFTMGLRNKIQSALNGVPAGTDSQRRRYPDDGRSLRGARQSQNRANPPPPRPNAGGQASQLTFQASSTSLPESWSRPRQLAMQGSSTSVTTTAAWQNN